MSNSVIFKKEYCLTEVDVFGIIKGYTNHPNLKPHGGYGMQTIILKAEHHISIKKTLESVAEAALIGARGNSGIIFAQYLEGLVKRLKPRS